MTAAHCFKNHIIPEEWIAVAGNVSRIVSGKNIYTIKEIMINHEYVARAALNDIAILKIENEFKFDENLKSLELAKSFESPKSKNLALK